MKDQETGQTKKAVTNQVINYVLDDVVKEVFSEKIWLPVRVRPSVSL